MRLSSVLLFAGFCDAVCDGDWEVQLSASTNTIEDSYNVAISGSAGPYSISINSNAGTVVQGDRTTNVVSNFQIPWDNKVLYALIGADSTGVLVGWAYCSANKLTDLWLEDTSGEAGFTKPSVTGTCSVQQTPKNVQLTTNDECYTIKPPSNTPTITGQDLKLSNGSPGSVTLSGDTYDVLPFAMIDCKTCTASNMDGGWMEMHAVMRSSNNICLGIFYLQIKQKATIPLDYVNCFFSKVDDPEFTAQYQLAAASSTTASTGSAAATSSSVSGRSGSGQSTTSIAVSTTSTASSTAGSGFIPLSNTAAPTSTSAGSGSVISSSSSTSSGGSAVASPTKASAAARHGLVSCCSTSAVLVMLLMFRLTL